MFWLKAVFFIQLFTHYKFLQNFTDQEVDVYLPELM